MVRLRMDRRLQGRVDPSDVLQEAYLDVAQQLPSFQAKPEMPFYLWLRLTTGQRLMRCTGSTSAPPCATPAARFRCIGGPCRKRVECRWPRSSWGG